MKRKKKSFFFLNFRFYGMILKFSRNNFSENTRHLDCKKNHQIKMPKKGKRFINF